VVIERGELISYQIGGYELIHQKGSPGWRQSDTEMFPIIGPLNEANYRIETPRGDGRLDQHGHLRELDYELVFDSETEAFFRKFYDAGTPVPNSKFPAKSSQESLSWPYSFTFLKKYRLKDGGLQVEFEISGEEGMPYMIGYHPAFKLYSEYARVESVPDQRMVHLREILAVGSRAYELDSTNEVLLHDAHILRMTTEGFGSFMLWTEVSNMLCIEPISHYPYAGEQTELSKGFRVLNGVDRYRVYIELVDKA
jgi:galactose mutarotase-like enzyme